MIAFYGDVESLLENFNHLGKHLIEIQKIMKDRDEFHLITHHEETIQEILIIR